MLPTDPTLPAEYLLDRVEKNDLPRERLKRLGAAALKTEELIAIMLRTGTRGENVLHLAERLLLEHGGLGGLARLPYSEMVRVRGIGNVKAIELQAIFELGRRLIIAAPGERPVIKSPADAVNLLADMSTLEQEVMRTVLLDVKNHVLAMPTVYRGSHNAPSVLSWESNMVALYRSHDNLPMPAPSDFPDNILHLKFRLIF